MGNGESVNIGKVADEEMCYKKVKNTHSEANAATFKREDNSCLAVFNATRYNVVSNDYKTCVFGGKFS